MINPCPSPLERTREEPPSGPRPGMMLDCARRASLLGFIGAAVGRREAGHSALGSMAPDAP